MGLIELADEDGLELMDARRAQFAKHDFVVRVGGKSAVLGTLKTRAAYHGGTNAFAKSPASTMDGIMITVQLDPANATPSAHFPGAVLAVRAAPDAQAR